MDNFKMLIWEINKALDYEIDLVEKKNTLDIKYSPSYKRRDALNWFSGRMSPPIW